MRRLSRQAVLVIVALVVSAVALGTAAFAGGRTFDAQNARAVDGFRAVGAGSTLANAAGKLVATRASGPGAGTFAPQFLGSVVQGRGAQQMIALRIANGATSPAFSVPGMVDVRLECDTSSGQFIVHLENERVSGRVADHLIGGSSVSGGTQIMAPGGAGSFTVDTFTDALLTFRSGFGPAAKVAVATLDLIQLNHMCLVTGQVVHN